MLIGLKIINGLGLTFSLLFLLNCTDGGCSVFLFAFKYNPQEEYSPFVMFGFLLSVLTEGLSISRQMAM